MVDPVPRGIWREGKLTDGISVNFVIEFEEDTQAGVRQNGMGGFGENVVA